MAGGGPGMPGGMGGMMMQTAGDYVKEAQALRSKAQKEFTANNSEVGGKIINEAAALEQAKDLLATREEEVQQARVQKASNRASNEGPTVTYHLPSRLTVPSRNDEQIIEVARIGLRPDYFYKALPVLTGHVYRLANITIDPRERSTSAAVLPGDVRVSLAVFGLWEWVMVEFALQERDRKHDASLPRQRCRAGDG
jgi:hypothetical protein